MELLWEMRWCSGVPATHKSLGVFILGMVGTAQVTVNRRGGEEWVRGGGGVGRRGGGGGGSNRILQVDLYINFVCVSLLQSLILSYSCRESGMVVKINQIWHANSPHPSSIHSARQTSFRHQTVLQLHPPSCCFSPHLYTIFPQFYS